MALKANKILPQLEAARIWSLYGFTSPEDLVLEDLALALGILVLEGRLDSAAARLVRSGDSGLLRINHNIRQPGRRRFAIAHEIGHWVMHKNSTQLLFCTDQDLLAAYKSSALEIEASNFAGALLMPERLFVDRAGGARPTTGLLRELANHFGTSLTATALRFVETSNDYCALVISEKGRIRWWRASARFGNHDLWIDNRTTLPRQSVAAKYFRGDPIPSQPREVELEEWLGHLPHIYSQSVFEQAIPLQDYDQVLSMLWLP